MPPAETVDRLTLIQDVADFLYLEAELLDQHRFHEWLDLFADDVRYVAPIHESVQGQPAASNGELGYYLFNEDKGSLTMYARDNRPKVPGEAALWRYKRGAARVALGRRDEARADLNAALAPDAARWVQGRARVELAKLAIGHGDRDGAIRESRAAIDLCGQAHDPVCLDEAKKVVR